MQSGAVETDLVESVASSAETGARIEVLTGGSAGAQYAFSRGECVLGRDPGCQLVIRDETISRRHARIVRKEDGFYLLDLNSRNGTLLNGQPVHSLTVLTDGDRIGLPESVLVFHELSGRRTRGPVGGTDRVPLPAAATAPTDAAVDLDRSSEILATLDATAQVELRFDEYTPSTLQAVMEITRHIGGTLDLDKVLPRVLESLLRIFPNADRGSLFRKGEGDYELIPVAARDREDGSGPLTMFSIDRSIARRVLSRGEAVLYVAGNQENLAGEGSVFDAGSPSAICAPLIGPSGRVLGLLYLEAEESPRSFSRNDLDAVVSVATLAGQAMEHARLHEESVRSLRLLHDIARAANQRARLDDVMRFALKRICGSYGWQAGHVLWPAHDDPQRLVPSRIWFAGDEPRFELLRELTDGGEFSRGRGLPGRVLESGRTGWSEDVTRDSARLGGRGEELGVCGAIALPVLSEKEVVGVIECFSRKSIQPDERMLATLSDVGTQLGRVVERRHMDRQMAEVAASEQRQLGQELHDGVGQELTGLGFLATGLAQKLAAESRAEAEVATRLVEGIRRTLSQVRTVSRGLVPVEVDAEGLRSALDQLAENTRDRYDLDCRFTARGAVSLSDNRVATQLFRIAQEAVQNAARHAAPQQITVSLEAEGPLVSLAVRDDGKGLPGQLDQNRGTGLRIMRHRAEMIGAELQFDRSDDGGTAVICTLEREEPA